MRTVEIVGLDLQADGGTHVQNTREVGTLRVVGTRSKGKSNKRLEIELTDPRLGPEMTGVPSRDLRCQEPDSAASSHSSLQSGPGWTRWRAESGGRLLWRRCHRPT